MTGSAKRVWWIATSVLTTVLAGCGGSGGSAAAPDGGSGGDGAALGLDPPRLTLDWSDPGAGAVQVAVDVEPTIGLDGTLVDASLTDPESGLFVDGPVPEQVAGRLSLTADGRGVSFRPDAPLARSTRYVFRLGGMTASTDQRLLEGPAEVRFTTIDDTPPALVGLEPDTTQLVDRFADFELAFDEALADGPFQTARVTLRDAGGAVWATAVRAAEQALTVAPVLDLPGSRDFTLRIEAVADAFGNATVAPIERTFRTIPDTTGPVVVGIQPAADAAISPLAWPCLTFDESIDLASVPPGSLLLRDEQGVERGVTLHASPDQRRLWLEPDLALPTESIVKIVLPYGPEGVTDLSGNRIDIGSVFHQVRISSDYEPVLLESVDPVDGAVDVPVGTALTVRLNKPVDPGSMTRAAFRLTDASGRELPIGDLQRVDDAEIRLTPAAELAPGVVHTLWIAGGPSGLLDTAGLALPTPASVSFTTAADHRTPELSFLPADGRGDVPVDAHLAILSRHPLAADSVDVGAFELVDDLGNPIEVGVELLRDDRVVCITPLRQLAHGRRYTLHVAGGTSGVRDGETGGVLPEDLAASFRCGFLDDATAPRARLTVDGIAERRAESLAVAPHGFSLDLVASDPSGAGVDWTTVAFEFQGPGTAPDDAELFAAGRIVNDRFGVRLAHAQALATGSWEVRAKVRDLCGNATTTPWFRFDVVTPDAGRLPFERTQVVWVRFDLDRDANGTPDFRDDLLRLGLAADGDPLGRNDRLERIVRDGVLRRLRALYERELDGDRRTEGSVPIVFTDREPQGVRAMQLAVGGFDPEGAPGRSFGDESSGTLGRAWFDDRNGRFDQHATAMSPGLGVFPAELWLFESSIHLSVYPSFVTRFASDFLPLAPALGGIPAGRAGTDSVVLAPGFDPETATAPERARWITVFDAADAWATVVGTIAAHEIGHAIGLVTSGRTGNGLHGDDTLHNEFAGIGDVMAASVGYDAMTSLAYRFRDLNLAYLRQRVLLK